MFDHERIESARRPTKNGPQQLKTDQDLHYTKNSCKITALNIFVHTTSSCNFNKERRIYAK